MVQEVIIAHRDRLARFGSELFDLIFNACGVKLVVDGQEGSGSDNGTVDGPQQLAEDLMAIVHVFSCREYGKRKYGTKHQRSQGASLVSRDQNDSGFLPEATAEEYDHHDVRGSSIADSGEATLGSGAKKRKRGKTETEGGGGRKGKRSSTNEEAPFEKAPFT